MKFFPSVTGFIHQISAQAKVVSQQRMAYTEMLQSDLAVRLELMARDAKYINSKVLVLLIHICLFVCLFICLFTDERSNIGDARGLSETDQGLARG